MIDNVEFKSGVLLQVVNCEVEALRVSFRVDVMADEQIVFFHFNPATRLRTTL